MKKALLWMAALVFMSMSCVSAGTVPISGGIKGALSISTFSGDSKELVSGIAGYGYDSVGMGTSSRTGLGIGGFVDIGGGKLSFQPELWYIQKGMKGTGIGSSGGGEGTIKLNYIEIPLLLKVDLGVPNAQVKPYLFVGPQVSFLASSTLDVTWIGHSESDEISSAVNSTDFGLTGGVGIDVSQFLLEARYDMGLTNVLKDTAGGDLISVKNSTFLIAAGYRFN